MCRQCSNPVENAIHPIAIGNKNGLFAGNERTGRCAAAIQSSTMDQNGIAGLVKLASHDAQKFAAFEEFCIF